MVTKRRHLSFARAFQRASRKTTCGRITTLDKPIKRQPRDPRQWVLAIWLTIFWTIKKISRKWARHREPCSIWKVTRSQVNSAQTLVSQVAPAQMSSVRMDPRKQWKTQWHLVASSGRHLLSKPRHQMDKSSRASSSIKIPSPRHYQLKRTRR